MRAVKMFATGSLVTVAVAILACGGSTPDTSGGVTDSGTQDVAVGPVADSSSETDASTADANLDAGPAVCTIDADLTTLAPPDASLNDAGASVGTCIGCARAHCASEIVNCNADCSCNNVFDCLFNCLGTVGGTLVYCYTGACGGSLSLSGGSQQGPEGSLLICAAKSCAAACDACSLYPGLCPTPVDAAADGAAKDGASGDGEAAGDGESDATAVGDATGDATGE